MDTKQDIAQRLRLARERLGITQDELAKRVNKSREALANYESGRRAVPSADLPLFAAALGVPISYFYGDVEPHEELLALFDSLTPEQQKQALAYLRFLREHSP